MRTRSACCHSPIRDIEADHCDVRARRNDGFELLEIILADTAGNGEVWGDVSMGCDESLPLIDAVVLVDGGENFMLRETDRHLERTDGVHAA